MSVFPEEMIYRNNESDYLGIKLELIKVKDHKFNSGLLTAYYGKLDGTCSTVRYISEGALEEIINGDHRIYFISREHLHLAVEQTLNKTLECINRFRETGEYFKKRS